MDLSANPEVTSVEIIDNGTAGDSATEAACKRLRQGDVMDFGQLPVIGVDSLAQISCPLGAAILTQTCDLVQPSKPYVVLAPVVELSANEGSLAKSGRMPQYVHLPSIDGDKFVDLTRCATVTKSALAKRERLHAGVESSDNVAASRFGAQIGRRFSRFAFPDEVQPWFRPLQEKVAKMYGKESPLGKLLRSTVDLRIQSTDWNKPGMQLIVHVIVPSGQVPASDDFDPAEISQVLIRELRPQGELIEDAGKIAERILAASSDTATPFSAADRYHLWNAFAEALANLCKPKPTISDPSVLNAVASVDGLLSTDDEFSLYLFRRTESLDLEHLSAPLI